VRAALALPWSTSPVEGQVNRLKTIKRQMHGRAGCALLRRCVNAVGSNYACAEAKQLKGLDSVQALAEWARRILLAAAADDVILGWKRFHLRVGSDDR
jgi:hypothetical protein